VESRIAYIHACLGFPTKAAIIDAATLGCLIGIPFATITNIQNFYPETKATSKGRLDQQRQGVRSTKAKTFDTGNQNTKLTPQKDVYVGV